MVKYFNVCAETTTAHNLLHFYIVDKEFTFQQSNQCVSSFQRTLPRKKISILNACDVFR